MKQLTSSKLGKEYDKAVYHYPSLYGVYIMWNARLDESKAGIEIAGRNINNLRDTDYTSLMAKSEEKLKSPLMRVKKQSEKAGLKLNSQKTNIMVFSSITAQHIEGEKWKQWQIFFSWDSESLWTVTAAMKLKDTCSLKGKLWQT